MGVTVFKHTNFKGSKKVLDKGEYPTIGIGNDVMSSLKIAPGYFVHLYKDSGFRGSHIVLFQGDYASLPGWNDKVSSMKIFEHDAKLFPLVSFYEHSQYQGFEQNLAGTGESTDYNFPFFKNDSISSLKVPHGVNVVLYKDSRLRGSSREFGPGEYPNLKVYGFNDVVSSVKILRPELELVGIEYTNEEVLPNGNPIGISDSTVNGTDIEQETSLTLEKELTKSTTRSWSNSTLVGITVSTTATVGIEKGPISAEISQTISTTLENTFTIGEEETKSETSKFTKTITITIPPRSVGEAQIILTPKKYKVDAIYAFVIKGTKDKIYQKVTIEIDDFQQGEAEIYARPIS
ncbi:beta/gamma crystallin-related protein [Limibacter armeniacum]|uniref:beta/gamma crystallin-related protein n=1 Tax=Limibacter armeniacum TaxID=466084 RepID=UPI002FE6BA2B